MFGIKMKFSIQLLTFLLLVKYFFLASGDQIQNSSSSSSQVTLDQLRKEFETIRSTLAKIDSRVTGASSGPTVDVSEWFDTITSLTRQLPFLRTLLDRVTGQIQSIGSRLGISGREESVLKLREAIKSWSESLQRLNRSMERLSGTYGTYMSEIASYEVPSNEREISKQEDIQLPLLSVALSNFIEATSILRNRIGTVLSTMSRTSSNVRIPLFMSEGMRNESSTDSSTETGNIATSESNSVQGIDFTITLNEIRSQIAKATQLLSRTASNFILQVTRRRVSNRKKISKDQAKKVEDDRFKGLDASGFISREFNQIRDFASKLSQG